MKRFTENDFITIRDMLGMNVSRKEIERVTGFSKSTIQRVARYKTWENYSKRKEREKINQRERENKTQANAFIETVKEQLNCKNCNYYSKKTGNCIIENKLTLQDDNIKCETFVPFTYWILSNNNAVCAFCGKEIELSDRDAFGYVKNNYNYCPACGKKMR